MKIKVETIQVPKKVTTYIASDGKEFERRNECEVYEKNLPLKGQKVIDTAVKELYDFYNEYPMILYNIENEDDWNLLVERVWLYHQTEKEYPGPGKYFAVQTPCGDYPDEFLIEEYDKYMYDIRHYYESIYDELDKAYYKFSESNI